jgi:hypothetical protein
VTIFRGLNSFDYKAWRSSVKPSRRIGLTDGYAELDLPFLHICPSFKACTQYALVALTVIERGCSIRPIVLKTVS